jgi:hypothetical protein
MEELWNWKKCKAKIRSLKGRLGFSDKPVLRFLKLSLYLEDGSAYDDLANYALEQKHRTLPYIYCILSSYADAEPAPETSNLVTSKQLQGGQYCNVAVERAKSSIQNVFGSMSKLLVKSAKVLGGSEVNFSYGDHSVRINSLPLVPLTIVLTEQDSEFPASAQIFFDESISHYLALEQIGMLSELTAERLKQAHQFSDEKRK